MEKVKKFIGKYVSDVHAQNVVCFPIFSSIDVTAGHLTPSQSLDVRFWAYMSGFAGAGLLYSKGNDLALRLGSSFGFNSYKSKNLINAMYGGAYLYTYSLAFYTGISKMSILDAQPGAASACVIGLFIGIPINYCTRLWRDAFKLDNQNPETATFLRGASLKKRIGAVMLSASLAVGIAGGAYTLKNYYSSQHTIEKTIDIRK